MRSPIPFMFPRALSAMAVGALLGPSALPAWAAQAPASACACAACEVWFEIDNASDETFPAFEVQLDAAHWRDLGPIEPGRNSLAVSKQVPGAERPGSFRLQRADGSWMLGAYWYSPGYQAYVRLDPDAQSGRLLSSGDASRPAFLDALESRDDGAFVMACQGGGVLYGGMACQSEYLNYKGRGWGLAVFPLTVGGFSPQRPVSQLLRYTTDVVATPVQGGVGVVGFRYNPGPMVDQELANWYGVGVGVGFARFTGGFSAP